MRIYSNQQSDGAKGWKITLYNTLDILTSILMVPRHLMILPSPFPAINEISGQNHAKVIHNFQQIPCNIGSTVLIIKIDGQSYTPLLYYKDEVPE